jgi:hypothetical protein
MFARTPIFMAHTGTIWWKIAQSEDTSRYNVDHGHIAVSIFRDPSTDKVEIRVSVHHHLLALIARVRVAVGRKALVLILLFDLWYTLL